MGGQTMIQTSYELRGKDFKKIYTQVLGAYYVKMYLGVLAIMLITTSLITKFTSGMRFVDIITGVLISLFPILIISIIFAIGLCYYDTRKTYKNFPYLTEGSFRVRFERSTIFMRINNQHTYRFNYTDTKMYKLGNCACVIASRDGKHIVVPKNLLTKEQVKELKSFVKLSA